MDDASGLITWRLYQQTTPQSTKLLSLFLASSHMRMELYLSLADAQYLYKRAFNTQPTPRTPLPMDGW
jgi:hypothetical protein